ncbi:Thermopsin [Metallosphaera sp. J1]|uniref:thermopsin n=1 Tax=Metallosphaera javensis (ex Hofmann et al. 2022) TaxID=99938 RepID=UPI001EDDBBD6|nr:thermopsin [Metallosphaera javensis (ex Hofmann et al. 2022)]MCG3109110.1 Thermopsin [Metallosphaera javensis (ex Hofmann et al. 2022)]
MRYLKGIILMTFLLLPALITTGEIGNYFHSNSEIGLVGNTQNLQPGFYTSEPAPMGIADYGVGPNGDYSYHTTQFLGQVYINSLQALNPVGSTSVTFQLNVVLNYKYNGVSYALWVQDVARFNTINNNIYFIDNIWNYSAPFGNVTSLQGNGQYGNFTGNGYPSRVYYYDRSYDQGSFVTLSLPASFDLLVNVTTNNLGQPVIYFWYNDGYGWVNYDTVTVTNVRGASNVYFEVNGSALTGSGNYYDAELDLAGPGGGSTTYIDQANVDLLLFYWNGHNFQEVINAYNYGSDTAETSSNLQVLYYYYLFSGLPTAYITTGPGTLGPLWNTSDITCLTVNTGLNQGYVRIYNDDYSYQYAQRYGNLYPFQGGSATFTLEPYVNYSVLVYNTNDQLVGEANVMALPGSVTTSVTQFNVIVPPTVDMSLGQTTNVPVQIQAYGYVTLQVSSPSQTRTYTLHVNGQTTFNIPVEATTSGSYQLEVNATLFPGFSVVKYVTINIAQPQVYSVTGSYSVNGQTPPSTPMITFTFPNGTKVTEPLNNLNIKVPSGTTYSASNITEGGYRWIAVNGQGEISGSTKLSITYYEQVQISFQYQGPEVPTVSYYYLGNLRTAKLPTTLWVDYGTNYEFPQILSSNGGERVITYNYQGSATSPNTVTVTYYQQYYVDVSSTIPVYAMVNGRNETLSSGWYNQSTAIDIENIPYYVATGEREVIGHVTPSTSLTVNSPLNVTITPEVQYYVQVSSPIPVYAQIGYENSTLQSGWYNQGTLIQVENITYYPSPNERYVITSITPSNVTVNQPETITISTVIQYRLILNSPIPTYALVNGRNETLSSGWYDAGTIINVENVTYYVNPTTRELVTGISPATLTMNGPATISVKTTKQYLIQINSQYPVTINGVQTNSEWVNAGSTVTLNANLPFYLTGSFTGTDVVGLGGSIMVDQPVQETLQTSISSVFLGIVIVAIAVAGAVLVILRRR